MSDYELVQLNKELKTLENQIYILDSENVIESKKIDLIRIRIEEILFNLKLQIPINTNNFPKLYLV